MLPVFWAGSTAALRVSRYARNAKEQAAPAGCLRLLRSFVKYIDGVNANLLFILAAFSLNLVYRTF
jgi:hypothetical protein